jgi:hypothetical protein
LRKKEIQETEQNQQIKKEKGFSETHFIVFNGFRSRSGHAAAQLLL